MHSMSSGQLTPSALVEPAHAPGPAPLAGEKLPIEVDPNAHTRVRNHVAISCLGMRNFVPAWQLDKPPERSAVTESSTRCSFE